jgi:Replication protein
MAGSFEHRAGNAGERPATRTAELPAYGQGQEPVTQSGDSGSRRRCHPAPIPGAQLAAGAGENSRPSLRAGFARGGAAEGGASEARYVHTSIATSSQTVFRGTTRQGEQKERKRQQLRMLARVGVSLKKGGEEAEAKRLWACRKWFRVGDCDDKGHTLECYPCNSMFCPNCAARKSRSLTKRILPNCRRAGKQYYFLTLTIPNISSLSRAQLDHLIVCFARLRRTPVWRQVKKVGGKYVGISGGIYSIECIYKRVRDDWHPHIHALLEMPGRNPVGWLDKLKAAWLEITGDAEYLKLIPVYGRSKSGKKTYRRVNRKALKELVKYVTKAADFADSPERVCEFLHAFRDVRRVQTFGSFLGVFKKPEREPGDEGKALKCSCGKEHPRSAFTWRHDPVPITKTVEMPDGSRQLAFDFAPDKNAWVWESPPEFQLMREEVERVKQGRLRWAGALPEVREEMPSLFAA